MTKQIFCFIIIIISINVNAQSILDANAKAEYLEQLKGKSVQDIKQIIVRDSIKIAQFVQMLNNFADIFKSDDNEKYTEANAVLTKPCQLPILKDAEDNFNRTTAILIFKQQYQLPNSGFAVEPDDKKQSANIINLDYSVKSAYKNGQILNPDSIKLLKIDSIKTYTEYEVPTKLAIVKMAITQKKLQYNKDTIYLDYVNKNYVKFHLPASLSENILEVHALTAKGKLIDNKSYQRNSFKEDKQAKKIFEPLEIFFKTILTEIDTKNFTTAELLKTIDTKLNHIKWYTRSEISYQQYSFKGNVQSLVFYFKEESKIFKKDITVINTDSSKTGYTVFENETKDKGICDFNGKIIVPANYKNLKQENENYYYTYDKGDVANYYFDAATSKLKDLNFKGFITAEEGGMAEAQITIGKDNDSMPVKKYGMYDNKGKLIIPVQYTFLQVINNIIVYKGCIPNCRWVGHP